MSILLGRLAVCKWFVTSWTYCEFVTGDILARYYAKGENVLYVSGSDCNGTPIAIRAKQEGVTAKEIANKYHEEFERCFRNLGFTYDCYTRTDSEHHHETVQNVFTFIRRRTYL